MFGCSTSHATLAPTPLHSPHLLPVSLPAAVSSPPVPPSHPRTPPPPPQFLGAAVVELLLSTDNICLFHQIFEHFKVPREVRPGLLFVGTPFMVAVRGVMFFALKEVYNSVRPIMFAIGLFCLYQGCYVIWVTCTGQDEDKDDPATSAVVVWGKWAFGDRLITHYEGSAFWVYVQGAAKLTPMFLCMAVIEVTDVMFCVDGVSTIFMVRLRVQGPRSSGWDPRSKGQGLYVGSRVRAPPPPRTKRRVKEARATPDEEESVRGASASMQRRPVRTRVLARFIANESRRSGCRCPHTTETRSSARTSQSRLGVYLWKHDTLDVCCVSLRQAHPNPKTLKP